MYERFIEELKLYSKVIRVLSKGYLPISLLSPSKLEKILKEVRIAIAKFNKDYDLVLTRSYPYYDMKLVTFEIDSQRNLIVQLPVFVQPYTRKRLIMYQIETVPVPILDENEQVPSYTELKIGKPYIALNEETYTMLHAQELKMCKKIGHEYYCKELFVVTSKTIYSCASTIYFNLESDIIKAILNSFLTDILIFTGALITLIITLVIIYVMYRQSKLKALINKHSNAMN